MYKRQVPKDLASSLFFGHRKGAFTGADSDREVPKEITKSVNLGVRLTPETADKLKMCAEKLQISRTEVIEKGIDLVEKSLKK